MSKCRHKLMLCCLLFAPCSEVSSEQVAVKLEVVDDAGAPVPQAKMLLYFQGIRSDQDREVEAETNAKGMLEVKGWSKGEYLDSILVISKAPAYYPSKLSHPVELEDRQCSLRLPIRKIGTPIPMYAQQVELELPEERLEIGFDFEKGDWVKPYGKGEVVDCTFTGTKVFEDSDNFKTTVIMSFPGSEVGMLEDPMANEAEAKLSDFKTLRQAPEVGYQPVYEFIRVKANHSREGSTKRTNYVFRSRTKLNSEGKLESCHYGKLIDAVDVARGSAFPDTKPKVIFTYYFNPTPNDRNLEFDPQRNLFKDLPSTSSVWAP